MAACPFRFNALLWQKQELIQRNEGKMNIIELLRLRGLPENVRVKLVRHQDKRYDVQELYRTGQLDTYQGYQAKPIFECDYIVSFIGLEGSLARFIGVYRVLGRRSAREVPVPPDFLYPDFHQQDDVFYQLVPMPGFGDLKDRIVIDWGKGALAWHQWLSEKEVVEVLPKGYVSYFPGYLDFILTFQQLSMIIENPSANREWHRMLGAVAGVYLIVESKTGMQYVGSAYGEEGILGRWRQYTKSHDGGNLRLQEILEIDPAASNRFMFSILHTLPRTLTKNEVIKYEVLYKNKLGSRAFGLNAN